ncbi:MAG: hypothetical protein WD077_14655 [Bacteroidia bacterium]
MKPNTITFILILTAVFAFMGSCSIVGQSNKGFNYVGVAFSNPNKGIDIILQKAILDYERWHDSLLGIEGFLGIKLIEWNDTLIEFSLKKMYSRYDLEWYDFNGVKEIDTSLVFVFINKDPSKIDSLNLYLKPIDLHNLPPLSSSVDFHSFRVYLYDINLNTFKVLNCHGDKEVCGDFRRYTFPFKDFDP